MKRGVVVLGSTGSVGTQALDVIARHPDDYQVVALAAGANTDLLAEQARAFGVPAGLARSCLDTPEVLAELAAHPDADVVLNAVVGFAGLPATIGALEAGKRLALANKESLIAAGPIVAKARAAGGGEIVPVDSEHSAVWQCLRSGRNAEVARIILTASGGPFRGRTPAELATVTRADALRHPTWTMGAKITIDSSTLMNKGLEVIEAHELFGVDFDHIDVVVHPQSIVHGMVEFSDGATIAQLSTPDMRLPIGLALERARPAAGGIRRDRLDEGRDAHVRAPRSRDLPMPRAGLRRRARGRHRARSVERGQRDRGRGVPRRPAPVVGHRRDRRGSAERGYRNRR